MNFLLFLVSLATSTITANLLMFASANDVPDAMLCFFIGGFIGWLAISLLRVAHYKALILFINLSIIFSFIVLIYNPTFFTGYGTLLLKYAIPSFFLIISSGLRLATIPMVLQGKELSLSYRVIPAVVLVSLPLSAFLLSVEAIPLYNKVILFQIVSLGSYFFVRVCEPSHLSSGFNRLSLGSDAFKTRIALATFAILLFSSIGIALAFSSRLSFHLLSYEDVITLYLCMVFAGVFIPIGQVLTSRLFLGLFLFVPMISLLIMNYLDFDLEWNLGVILVSGLVSGILIPKVQALVLNIEELGLRKTVSSDYSLIRFTIPAVSGYLLKVFV